ncbi:hypothetical protein NQD34_011880 [Periophthalmus magnuspinnatus]|nr:hypothetical protein NQD34_011880 [Periophthalmus magnuspinnatus]
MGSQLIWLPLLLLIYYMDQVQGNHKMHDTHLKSDKTESAIGDSVISLDLSTKFHNGFCKCKGHGRWEEKKSCTCTKSARGKNRHRKMRKLCQRKKMKHLKICHQVPHRPIVPI